MGAELREEGTRAGFNTKREKGPEKNDCWPKCEESSSSWKFQVLGTTHQDSFNLFPLSSCVNSQTFGKVCHIEGLHVGGAWRPRQGLYPHPEERGEQGSVPGPQW